MKLSSQRNERKQEQGQGRQATQQNTQQRKGRGRRSSSNPSQERSSLHNPLPPHCLRQPTREFPALERQMKKNLTQLKKKENFKSLVYIYGMYRNLLRPLKHDDGATIHPTLNYRRTFFFQGRTFRSLNSLPKNLKHQEGLLELLL